jgi:Tfp pilus assembly protein PilN
MWVLTSDEQERKEVDMYIGGGLLLLILIIVLLVILF